MKRRQWVPLTLVAITLAALLWGMPQLNGESERASAHVSTGTAHLELDMDVTDGTGPCNPVNTSRNSSEGQTYKVAVCLSDSEFSPAGIQFNIIYNDDLNQCVPDTSPGTGSLDGNPDANVGATTFTTPDLGVDAQWDCAGTGGLNPPKCDANTTENGPGKGVATLACGDASGPYTLPVGAGVSSPIAMVEFHVLSGGTDTLSLNDVAIIDLELIDIVRCNSVAGFDSCFGGTDTKGGTPAAATPTPGPSATPTATKVVCGVNENATCTPIPRAWTSTPTPTPTNPPAAPTEPPPPPPPPLQPTTPGGGQGPQVSPPATGDGSGSSLWTNPIAALIAGIGAISLATGGLCFRVARRR